MTRIRCLQDVHRGASLKKGKIYEAQESQLGWFALVDETGEEYAYPPNLFEEVKGYHALLYAANKELIAALAGV